MNSFSNYKLTNCFDDELKMIRDIWTTFLLILIVMTFTITKNFCEKNLFICVLILSEFTLNFCGKIFTNFDL